MSFSKKDLRAIKNNNIKNILKEAMKNPQCTIDKKYENYNIYVSIPDIASKSSIYHNFYGLYITLYDNKIKVWVAEIENNCITYNFNICEYDYKISLPDIIIDAVNKANICDFCKKLVGLENLKQISFVGKCCIDCEPIVREKYEYDK